MLQPEQLRANRTGNKFPQMQGRVAMAVLISILPKAGTRPSGSYLPGATYRLQHMLKAW
jgi:hypothetical protein